MLTKEPWFSYREPITGHLWYISSTKNQDNHLEIFIIDARTDKFYLAAGLDHSNHYGQLCQAILRQQLRIFCSLHNFAQVLAEQPNQPVEQIPTGLVLHLKNTNSKIYLTKSSL